MFDVEFIYSYMDIRRVVRKGRLVHSHGYKKYGQPEKGVFGVDFIYRHINSLKRGP